MGFNKKSGYNLFLVAVIVVCVGLLLIQNIDTITGKATSATATSNVTIEYYFSISLSGNLSNGIEFGSINATNLVNINATDNNISGSAPNQTGFWINVSSDSSTAVDFCVKADSALISGANSIHEANESYVNSTTSTGLIPDVTLETSFTTSNIKSGKNIAIGGVNYYRFWLDIPLAQAAGTYNNTVSFTGKNTGAAC
ncbi:MAG TPA: hypothetical protein ENG87_05365 [Candidatus Pacearchaeota archaeon]|nr:hypothetical protein BMS3Abin17_00161 [archaeon BMS3Abin17]HDK42786.1 hypothetical protein [Candidatus Pacearchaeota archaeon]HDZ60308.1 hypothetical protein [Candidatus Pacearchaeota archaeon]